MTVTLVLHHILNRKWYKSVFKGKYSPYRITMTAVNSLMLVSIALTALSGMSMSGHAVPFMYWLINVMTARELHLAMSYWSFILMGLHIGLHMKAMTAKLPDKGKIIFKAVLTGASGVGLRLFIKSDIVNYIFFRTHFAFLDYTTAKWLIILQNLAMLLFFVLVGYTLSELTQKGKGFSAKQLIWLGCAIAIGVVMFFALRESSSGTGFSSEGWNNAPAAKSITAQISNNQSFEQSSIVSSDSVNDGFILVEGGTRHVYRGGGWYEMQIPRPKAHRPLKRTSRLKRAEKLLSHSSRGAETQEISPIIFTAELMKSEVQYENCY